jgi:tripartite-type tricarboxylate transporter receptor subunit TctC
MKQVNRLIALAAALVLATPLARAADAFPSKPIHFIVTSAAGSPLDVMMRELGKLVADSIGQTVVVENRTGGSGAVGMQYAMNQPADGYVVVSATGTTSFMMAGGLVSFTPDEWVVLRGLQAEPSAVAVRADSPYKTLRQLVDALRSTPDKVNVGGYAVAGFHQYVFYRFQQAAKFNTVWIPFDGGNQAAAALLGRHIDVAVMTPSSALAQVQSGDIRLLAISTAARDPYFPSVPTFREQGFDVVESIWRGVMVKKGTPAAAIQALNAAIDKAQATQEWQRFMKTNLQTPMRKSTDEMQALVRAEVDSRRDFLKTIGVAK